MPLSTRLLSTLLVFTGSALAAVACGTASPLGPPQPDGGTLDPIAPDAAKKDAGQPSEDASEGGTKPGDPTITVGKKDHILLIGTVVLETTTMEGAVLVEGQQITCVDTVATLSLIHISEPTRPY